MDQQKIGRFLKELRKEKNITQEHFAEIMGVSNRTVSRWETGSNMPDLDVLIQIADYHGVELREILDGERKNEHMDEKMKETVYEIADLAYHVMVLMVENGISVNDIRKELASRHIIDHKVKQEKMASDKD